MASRTDFVEVRDSVCGGSLEQMGLRDWSEIGSLGEYQWASVAFQCARLRK